MPSLFDTARSMFTGNHNAAVVHQNNSPGNPPQQQQPNPNDKVPQANPGADPANVPGNGQSLEGKDPVISQLDNFSKLWETPAVDPKAGPDPLTQPLLSFDPTKFATEARKMNFTAGIDPALVTKALGGDAQALMDVINHSTQNAFTTASQLSANMVEGATRTNNSRLTPLVDKQFRELMLTQQRTDDAVLQHPAVAPVLELAKRQLLQQNPNMHPAEIQSKAEDWVANFANVFQQDKSRKPAAGAPTSDPSDFSGWSS